MQTMFSNPSLSLSLSFNKTRLILKIFCTINSKKNSEKLTLNKRSLQDKVQVDKNIVSQMITHSKMDDRIWFRIWAYCADTECQIKLAKPSGR